MPDTLPESLAAATAAGSASMPAAPFSMLAELTHRCPLACPYCSNPLALEGRDSELTAGEWARVFDEAARLGVLQLHLSGGEPMSRRDIVEIARAASAAGLYTNLITSGIGLDADRLAQLAEAGLDHIQLSIQDTMPDSADRIAGYRGAHARKMALAAAIRAAGFPLTINAVVHRANIDRMQEMVALAVSLGAGRVEVAHAQYYGWALKNRAALMPTKEQALRAVEQIAHMRAQYAGTIVIDAVIPDYYASQPKACMGGWAKQALNVTPSGRVLPCHAAETIPRLEFWSVRDHALGEIWTSAPAFNAFRGEDWMREPCRSCALRTVDFGGCRCQAMAIVGDPAATDPACALSPHHEAFQELATEASAGDAIPQYGYRGR